ncbi:DNase I-like protein, putative [Plasmodium relictum]|uniref:DNase I-like protein, putative n=1 Tax=Plasmodium relictum TaxID=85471 RepID=A0A1J1H7F9_PLARL|nr:DNase I-like protein, putative [Plasmodium relictum]CRH00724.1 DNase I-like protein, putative [Plasmodium relictum]
MFYTKNSIIPWFFKKTYIVNKLKKNEYQFFVCKYIGNAFYIRKNDTNTFTNCQIRLCYCKYSEKEIRENNSYDNYLVRKTQINKNIKNIRNKNKIKIDLRNNSSNNNYAINNSINNKKKNFINNFTNNKENNNISSTKNCININEESTMDLCTNNSARLKILSKRILKSKDQNISKNKDSSTGENKVIIECKGKKKKYLFEEFSIFSFNILANSLVDYKYDSNCPNVMNWMNRKKWIFQSIVKKLSDIICLQEVEKSYFVELQGKLKNLNYKGLFLKKKKETCKDGICIFYNTKVFELLFFDEIIYDKSPLLKKWHVGLIVALKNLKSKKIEYYDETDNKSNIKDSKNNLNDNISDINDIVIVSNTHLIFDSYKGDIKLYQLCYMTYRLILMMNKCINYLKKKDETDENTKILEPSIIFCGDFNITPNSLLYYFIINRYINLKNINLKFLSGQYLMFKKQYYFNNYFKGIQIRTMFDESIIEDLKYEECNNSLENIKKESLFFFFKSKNILNKEYLINIFSKKNNYLNDYNFFDHYDTTKNKDKNIYDNKAKNLYFNIEENEHEYNDNKKILHRNEDNYNNYEHNDEEYFLVERKEKFSHEKEKDLNNDKKKEIEVIINEKEDDFILYYPLYFKSIYNRFIENRIEKYCYKYDSIDKLSNKENNVMLNDAPFTVFHGKQKGCVDYIFYSYKNLRKISCTKLPPFDKLAKYGCLPNKKYRCSDHLYLHATLIRRNIE